MYRVQNLICFWFYIPKYNLYSHLFNYDFKIFNYNNLILTNFQVIFSLGMFFVLIHKQFSQRGMIFNPCLLVEFQIYKMPSICE